MRTCRQCRHAGSNSVRKQFVVSIKEHHEFAARSGQANVASGLSPGEAVVIEGVDKLQQGMKVAARMAGTSNIKGNE